MSNQLYQFLPYPENKPMEEKEYPVVYHDERGHMEYAGDKWQGGRFRNFDSLIKEFLAPVPEPATNAWPQFLKDVDHALQMAHAKNAGIYIAAAGRELLKSVNIPADPDDEKAAEAHMKSGGWQMPIHAEIRNAFLAGCAHKAQTTYTRQQMEQCWEARLKYFYPDRDTFINSLKK